MLSIIGQIGIFMICAQAIMHFRPKEVYGKYLRLLLGVMILVQIFQPFANLFWNGSGKKMQEGVQLFQRNLEESMEEAMRKAAVSQEKLQEMSMEEIQKRMESGEMADGAEKSENSAEKTENREQDAQKIEIAPIEEIQITGEGESWEKIG